MPLHMRFQSWNIGWAILTTFAIQQLPFCPYVGKVLGRLKNSKRYFLILPAFLSTQHETRLYLLPCMRTWATKQLIMHFSVEVFSLQAVVDGLSLKLCSSRAKFNLFIAGSLTNRHSDSSSSTFRNHSYSQSPMQTYHLERFDRTLTLQITTSLRVFSCKQALLWRTLNVIPAPTQPFQPAFWQGINFQLTMRLDHGNVPTTLAGIINPNLKEICVNTWSYKTQT